MLQIEQQLVQVAAVGFQRGGHQAALDAEEDQEPAAQQLVLLVELLDALLLGAGHGTQIGGRDAGA